METTNQTENNALELESMLSEPEATAKIGMFAQQNSISYYITHLLAKALYEQSLDTTLRKLSRIEEVFGERKTGTIHDLERQYFTFPNGHKTYFLNQELHYHLEAETGLPGWQITAEQVRQFAARWQNVCASREDKTGKIVIIDPIYKGGYKFIQKTN